MRPASTARGRWQRVFAALPLLALCTWPWLAHWWGAREVAGRLDRLDVQLRASAPRTPGATFAAAFHVHALAAPVRSGVGLASWETIAGCGAGAGTGGGGGVKWIGKGVTGGLFQLQCQGNYIQTKDGYQTIATALVNRNITEKWNLGVLGPFVYKYQRNVFDSGVDISNGGLGDVNVLLTRKLGAINDTSVTLGVGLPTGVHDARYLGSPVRQDMQLGHGEPTASLTVDHIMDEMWGLIVVGGNAAWRGGENELKSYRAPSGSIYGYAGRALGPFMPAAGLTLLGFTERDRNQGLVQPVPLATLALNGSIEYSTEWVALLAGVSFPFATDGLAPWTAAFGLSLSPF